MRRLVPVAALAALVGLGLTGCGDELVGEGYAGEPLASIGGSMVPSPGTDVAGPVRLALVWYPQWLAAESPTSEPTPLTIVTEDVAVQGTFPVDFRFPLYRPPPPSALAPLGEGLAGKGAFGILLAYHDRDGDRRLDPIRIDGAPVDQVIASSLLGDPQAAFAVVYVDAPQPEGTGLRPGFNLIRGVNDGSAAPVPLDTRMRLALTTGGPIYDAFVCEAGWLTFLLADVCGLPGGPEEEGPPGFAVDGGVGLDGERLVVELRVTSLDATYPEAVVTVNGRAVPWVPGRDAFVLEEDASTLVRPGASVFVSATAAGTSIGRSFPMPGDFAISTPVEFGTVHRPEGLTLSWTASTAATEYFLGFEAPPDGMATISTPADPLALTFPLPAAVPGPGTAFVEARVWPEDARAFVVTKLVRRRAFYVGE
jgi:hypothetical protein